MLVKDLIQMLSEFSDDMEVAIKSTCGLLDIATEVRRKPISTHIGQGKFRNTDTVLITGVHPADYYRGKNGEI